MVETNDDHLKRLGINMNNLEREMNSAIAKESRYWLENDAKIRAVQQGVPTYDDFRELVAGCHLKPLERSKLINSTGQKSSWNSSTTLLNNNSMPYEEPKMNSKIQQQQHTKTITTPQEFIIHWRHIKSSTILTDKDKENSLIELLFHQSNELLENLFNTGLGVSFLPDILSILDHAIVNTEIMSLDDNNRSSIIDKIFFILKNFQKSKQFLVAVDCLVDSEIEIAHQFLHRLYCIGSKLKVFEEQEENLKKIFETFHYNIDSTKFT
ncbi:unnamed protein product [Heterobilharzia americana]|nr:unnamed protein product [Heterobilharzia americana]CAH8455460.1 unnamed protein product [Heterobilharzia americana]